MPLRASLKIYGCPIMTGDERYDIRPNNEGGWDVVDTDNRYGTESSHTTHAEALQEAIRRDTP